MSECHKWSGQILSAQANSITQSRAAELCFSETACLFLGPAGLYFKLLLENNNNNCGEKKQVESSKFC